MIGDRLADPGWTPIKQIKDEVIRMLRNEVVALERFSRKVLEIEGYDEAGAGVDGRGNHMPVIGIRQFDGRDQVREACHQAVPNVMHSSASACAPGHRAPDRAAAAERCVSTRGDGPGFKFPQLEACRRSDAPADTC